MMNSSISFLGGSQTFVGVLATLIILCINRNENNFIFEVLTDIRNQIVEYAKRLKPSIAIDSIKNALYYKAILLFLQNDKCKEKNKELCGKCEHAVEEIEMAKFSLQGRVTNWDSSIIKLANIIENKKEQQKAPMFAFAFCIVVFIIDEFLRSQYILFNSELLAILSLFTIYVTIYWVVKWIVFMLKDSFEVDELNKEPPKGLGKLLQWFVSLKNRNQFLFHLIVTFCLLYIFSVNYDSINDNKIKVIFLILICYVPFLLMGVVHIFIQDRHSDGKITMHYVYHFFYMLFLSIGILIYVKIFISDILSVIPFQDEYYLFGLKFLVIGFILCVGLLCPFVCTLIKFNMMYLRACVKYVKINLQARRKVRELRNKFIDLANQITVNVQECQLNHQITTSE